jgi:hypothetical protein
MGGEGYMLAFLEPLRIRIQKWLRREPGLSKQVGTRVFAICLGIINKLENSINVLMG